MMGDTLMIANSAYGGGYGAPGAIPDPYSQPQGYGMPGYGAPQAPGYGAPGAYGGGGYY